MTRLTDYSKVLGRANPSTLTRHQREVNERTPPSQEQLVAMFGYDSNVHRLFYMEGGAARYVPNSDFSLLINGRAYAIWRVKSMLLLGNPDCVPPNYAKLKEFQPPNKPMAPIPPEKLK